MSIIPTDRPLRLVRSFVRRSGRLTAAQDKATEQGWPQFGIEYSAAPLDLDTSFGRHAPRYLEIGFGMGTSLAAMAAANPDTDYLGIEVHRPGVGSLLIHMQEQQLNNIRIMCHDAVEVLEHMIPDHSLDGVYLFFPDPWHKKRHHKRRIVNPKFVQRLAHKLKHGGLFHMATDWEEYAHHMMEVMTACPSYLNQAGLGAFSPRPDYRVLTKFEKRGQRLGHGVWDLLFTRC